MAKNRETAADATKYTVLVGCNVPDPSGARDESGKPLELRLEAGTEILGSAVSPKALDALLAMKAITPAESQAN